jgi:CHRD domain
MKYASPALVMAAALMLQAPAAHAIPITFVANLTQALEVPPTGSPGTGSATVVLDNTANTMHVDVTFSGLTSGTNPLQRARCLSVIGRER